MLELKGATRVMKPLDTLEIHSDHAGRLVVRDGKARIYYDQEFSKSTELKISGALGTHIVQMLDNNGRIVDEETFTVDCKTTLKDKGGKFKGLFDMLYYTLHTWGEGATTIRLNDKFYKFYVCWLRDHVHTLKGMKYFDGDVKTGIELYADTQQPNGMIWDRHEDKGPHTDWRDFTFSYGGFTTKAPDGRRRFERIPVENDVEYLFLEGLYFTWKATGDDAWMSRYLDNALKAVEYSTSDPYRWSEKYQLLKRGYTIDTWDFQSHADCIMTGGAMCVDKDKSYFGVMHGDNTGMSAGCRYLAEMLEVAGRSEEAKKMLKLSEDLKSRLDKVAWNGEFYTHHVPEKPNPNRDLGNTPEDRQVSLSNSYALNRGLTQEQCAAIIKTYQRIREEMPDSSPGEFYQIYPIFEKGFGDHGSHWEYMNGGVTTIVAGELAHGAFEHGFETYGVDILERVKKWGEAHQGYFDCCLRGAMPEVPERTFAPVNIRNKANVNFRGDGSDQTIGWLGEKDNDFRNMPTGDLEFEGIAFEVIDPVENENRACIGMSGQDKRYRQQCEIDIPATSGKSIYLLQTASGANGGELVGSVELVYDDGSSEIVQQYLGSEIGNWFMPADPSKRIRRGSILSRVAWRGPNGYFPNVGCYVTGLNNPRPQSTIKKIRLLPNKTRAVWMVLGITLCDEPVFFMPSDVSFGIPDNWGASAVVYALIEGLAGVKHSGCEADPAQLSPRWSAAGVDEAEATIKLEASGSYVAYQYASDAASGKIEMEIAASGKQTDLSVLLPNGRKAKKMLVNGKAIAMEARNIEHSAYACATLHGTDAKKVTIELA